MDLKEIGINTRNSVYSAQDRDCFWWSGHCCPMHCDRFRIYCAPPNLGITRTWICRLHFTHKPIFSGLRFFNEPEISDSGPPLRYPETTEADNYYYYYYYYYCLYAVVFIIYSPANSNTYSRKLISIICAVILGGFLALYKRF